MAGLLSHFNPRVIHGFSFKRGGDGGVHHQLRQAHGGFVQYVDRFADRVIVVAIFDGDESLLQSFDVATFFVGELLPREVLLRLRERGQDGIGFAPRFDDLAGCTDLRCPSNRSPWR